MEDGAARPYPHQVGGHGQLTVTPQGNVLKPSSEKEHRFYSYIHSERLPIQMRWIRSMTPIYFGEAQLPDLLHSVQNHLPADTSQQSPPLSNPLPLSNAPSSPKLRWRTTDGEGDFSMSPWVARMGSRWQHASKNPARRARPSIALEDINKAFVLPCVMDCKIGTRHYDDDASEEKRRRHIMKANSTTTAKCGVRYTGMQAFKREKSSDSRRGMFEVCDKYHGRTLREPDLVPEATWFFHDNHTVRTDCVRRILEKIQHLRRLLVTQHHFFFYSSSLLLVYEGSLPESHPVRVDVRMIDFAHTVLSEGRRDDGYVHGIDYLIGILEQILENDRAGTTVLPLRPRRSPVQSQDVVEDGNDVAIVNTNLQDGNYKVTIAENGTCADEHDLLGGGTNSSHGPLVVADKVVGPPEIAECASEVAGSPVS